MIRQVINVYITQLITSDPISYRVSWKRKSDEKTNCSSVMKDFIRLRLGVTSITCVGSVCHAACCHLGKTLYDLPAACDVLSIMHIRSYRRCLTVLHLIFMNIFLFYLSFFGKK